MPATNRTTTAAANTYAMLDDEASAARDALYRASQAVTAAYLDGIDPAPAEAARREAHRAAVALNGCVCLTYCHGTICEGA